MRSLSNKIVESELEHDDVIDMEDSLSSSSELVKNLSHLMVGAKKKYNEISETSKVCQNKEQGFLIDSSNEKDCK